MSNNINYSIVKKESGNISVSSHVTSFGLDHVTEKDILSFYSNFSSYAAFDTGLLPVSDTGLLAIRTAGEHTQFVYQHAPGMYHVNWADFEGQYAAQVYYVAQPYRIIICDMYQGNLYGARTFYSPAPIVSPDQPLYNVNLPNINCYGYRGNGVGWICLYHKEDWSSLPFNEKIVRFIERCSGVETYNYANMSETDGIKLYKQHRSDKDYLYDPQSWEQKSSEEGYAWTLDPELWIPVIVQDKHNQDKNYNKGQPLTIGDAMTGTYASYYGDEFTQKPINKIINSDMEISHTDIMQMFVQAYAASANLPAHLKDPYSNTLKIKQQIGSSEFTQSSLFNEEQPEEELPFCSHCESEFDDEVHHDNNGEVLCANCVEDSFIYVSGVGYVCQDDDALYYSEYQGEHFFSPVHSVYSCENCNSYYGSHKPGTSIADFPIFGQHFNGQDYYWCASCISHFVKDNSFTLGVCHSCNTQIIEEFANTKVSSDTLWIHSQDKDPVMTYETLISHYCNKCQYDVIVCPCGSTVPSNSLNPCLPTLVQEDPKIEVIAACATCINNKDYVSCLPDKHKFSIETSVLDSMMGVVQFNAVDSSTFTDDQSPF